MPPRLPSALSNGEGAFVHQLRKLTFYFCEQSGSSRGIREYILSRLVPFARENAQTEIAVTYRKHRHPVIRAEYLNGYSKNIPVRNVNEMKAIQFQVDHLRNSSGLKPQPFHKRSISRTESPRGIWSPFDDAPFAVQPPKAKLRTIVEDLGEVAKARRRLQS